MAGEEGASLECLWWGLCGESPSRSALWGWRGTACEQSSAALAGCAPEKETNPSDPHLPCPEQLNPDVNQCGWGRRWSCSVVSKDLRSRAGAV